MNNFPEEDQNIVNFLQQYRPEIPPASPNLEQQILQQVKVLPIRPLHRLSHLWLIPSAIIAGFLTLFIGYPALILNYHRVAETSNLETFMESNWQTVVSENSVNYNWQAQEVYSGNNIWQTPEVYTE
jgi:hypothetical protein